jgi:hypothetical protein
MSVTGYYHDDLGSYWQVNEPFKTNTKTFRDALKCGDMLSLASVIEGYSLRT